MLTATEIARRLKAGLNSKDNDPLSIVPFPPLEALKKTHNASVDLRLGNWFLTMRENRVSEISAAGPDEQWSESQLTKAHYVGFGDSFVIHPGGFALGVTLEWIRLPRTLGAYVVGKSGWGRAGLIIATAVGVHPRFNGCLTLELSNVGTVPVGLHPGVAICQVFFHSVEGEQCEHAQESKFSGSRRPRLGKIQLDEIARKLMQRGPPALPLFNPDGTQSMLSAKGKRNR